MNTLVQSCHGNNCHQLIKFCETKRTRLVAPNWRKHKNRLRWHYTPLNMHSLAMVITLNHTGFHCHFLPYLSMSRRWYLASVESVKCQMTYDLSICMKILQITKPKPFPHFPGCIVNSLRPKQNRRHFADDIFKCIFLNENEWISLRISLKFIPKVRMNNIPSLVQIMAWRRPGDKPLS